MWFSDVLVFMAMHDQSCWHWGLSSAWVPSQRRIPEIIGSWIALWNGFWWQLCVLHCAWCVIVWFYFGVQGTVGTAAGRDLQCWSWCLMVFVISNSALMCTVASVSHVCVCVCVMCSHLNVYLNSSWSLFSFSGGVFHFTQPFLISNSRMEKKTVPFMENRVFFLDCHASPSWVFHFEFILPINQIQSQPKASHSNLQNDRYFPYILWVSCLSYNGLCASTETIFQNELSSIAGETSLWMSSNKMSLLLLMQFFRRSA